MTSFPYRISAAGEWYPILDIFISHRNNTTRVFPLLDSGASISIFSQEVAESLKLKIETGELINMQGVGGSIKGYLHKLKLQIGEKALTAPVVFSKEYKVSFNLLGRKGIFEHFQITINERKREIRLT